MSTALKRCVALLRHQLFLPSEVFIAEQARALREFAPLLIGRSLAGTPAEGLPYYVPPSSALERLRYVLGRDPRLFMPELAARGPVLLHAHFGVEAVYGMELAERLGVPLVTTFHGFDATLKRADLLRSRKPSWIHYLLQRSELARRGTLFLGVSNFVRERLERLGFPSERTRRHYIGVDPAAFAGPRAAEESRVLLHVARLVEVKGTAYLLDAFARLASKHRRAELVVIGDGPLRPRLERHAAELGIEDRVRWLGATPHAEVRRQLERAAAFCLPSCTLANGAAEGLGLALLEAAASGVPVVATRSGGIPEAVADGETGYLVAERDVDALAAALDALLDSPDLRRRLGEAGRRLVQTRFDLHRQTRELERLYEEALCA